MIKKGTLWRINPIPLGVNPVESHAFEHILVNHGSDFRIQTALESV